MVVILHANIKLKDISIIFSFRFGSHFSSQIAILRRQCHRDFHACILDAAKLTAKKKYLAHK